MRLNDAEKRLISIMLKPRINKLKLVIEKWDALPDDTIVNDLDRFAFARAKEDLPKHEALLKRITEGDPNPEPVTDLDAEDLDQMMKTLDALHEAKYYTNQASNNMLDHYGEASATINQRIGLIYEDLENLESPILGLYPQVASKLEEETDE